MKSQAIMVENQDCYCYFPRYQPRFGSLCVSRLDENVALNPTNAKKMFEDVNQSDAVGLTRRVMQNGSQFVQYFSPSNGLGL